MPHRYSRAGNQAVQISTPTIETAGDFYGVARHIESLSHGSPMDRGFSSGGTLAAASQESSRFM